MTKPIVAGDGRIYRKTISNRVFECEQFPDGNWLLFELRTDAADIEHRDYCNDFVTKRAAWNAAEGICRGED